MKDGIEAAYYGLVAHGIFAKVEDASFDGDDGTVKRTKLVLHDPIGLAYIEIFAMGEEAIVLTAQAANHETGSIVSVLVSPSKTGKLMFRSFAGKSE